MLTLKFMQLFEEEHGIKFEFSEDSFEKFCVSEVGQKSCKMEKFSLVRKMPDFHLKYFLITEWDLHDEQSAFGIYMKMTRDCYQLNRKTVKSLDNSIGSPIGGTLINIPNFYLSHKLN